MVTEIGMKHAFLLFVCCFCLSCLSGCGVKYPADFPKVYPMVVTVTDGVTPLSDVRIMFYPVSRSADAGYATSGYIDTNGVAKVTTSQGAYSKAGIPAGEYVVAVEDVINVKLDAPPEVLANPSFMEEGRLAKEEARLRAEYMKKVPEVLCRLAGSIEERSPLRYTATKGKNTLSIDVAQYK